MQHPVRAQQNAAICVHRKWVWGAAAASALSSLFIQPVLLTTIKLPRSWAEFLRYKLKVRTCVWRGEHETEPETISPPSSLLSVDPAGNAWSWDGLVTLWLVQQMVSTETSVSGARPPSPHLFTEKWTIPERRWALKENTLFSPQTQETLSQLFVFKASEPGLDHGLDLGPGLTSLNLDQLIFYLDPDLLGTVRTAIVSCPL